VTISKRLVVSHTLAHLAAEKGPFKAETLSDDIEFENIGIGNRLKPETGVGRG